MNNKKYLQSFFAALLISGCLCINAFANTPKTTYTNPIIAGFNPDPSVIRVGEDYYLVTSTFEYFPGVPVYHSRNLVNWSLIGHALARPEQLNLTNTPSTAGIYAPTIRYSNGTFYMITTLVDDKREPGLPKGNFLVTAKNPAGPWSKPHWIANAPGIDPSLFFDDDGKVYYTGNRKPEVQVDPHHKEIWTQEIDINTFTLKGPIGVLDSKPYFESKALGSVVAFEGAHLYKKNGRYYLSVSHGGTGVTHAISMWRSQSPLGPWEMNPANPILTHRGFDRSGITSTGHADFVEAQDGSWWVAFLGVRSWNKNRNPMGRETFLAPVDWSGEWPVINPAGEHGRTAFQHEAPKLPNIQPQNHDFFDDFDQATLNREWTFIRTPKNTWWKLTDKGLQIKLRKEQIAESVQPSFIGKRVTDTNIEVISHLSFDPKNEKSMAGLALLRGHDPYWTLVKEKVNGKPVISAYDKDKLLAQAPLGDEKDITLSMVLADLKVFFAYKPVNGKWIELTQADATAIEFPPAGRFTGSFIGMYGSTRGEPEGDTAEYHWYQMKALP